MRPTSIEQALKAESPYLLFYQVQPIEGDPGNIAAGEQPPIYSLTSPSTSSDPPASGISRSSRDTKSSLADSGGLIPGRQSFDDLGTARTSLDSERRTSVAFTDSSLTSPLRAGEKERKEGGASLTVSRRGSKSGRSKSRPGSQIGEGRLSASLTRLAGKLGGEKMESAGVGGDTGEVGAGVLDVGLGFDDAGVGTERGKLRKEKDKEKERGRNWQSAQQRLVKGKGREKPDRECGVM